MKAMILVAGLGTRLRPLTDRVPKCMVPLGGKPLVQHTVERCRAAGITEIVMNPCHLAQVIMEHFGDGSRFGVQIQYLVESSPLGTAGSVKRAAHLLREPFLVWYGDNLSRCDLRQVQRLHTARGGEATMALFHREDVSQSGIVGLDGQDRIVRFLEKPKPEETFSHWVNAGIYILEPAVLELIPSKGFSDFGRDVFPLLLAQGRPIYGYRLTPSEGLWWIDRPEDLARLEQSLHSLTN